MHVLLIRETVDDIIHTLRRDGFKIVPRAKLAEIRSQVRNLQRFDPAERIDAILHELLRDRRPGG